MTTVKKYLIAGGVAAGLAVLGFAYGRYSAPVKIVEKEKIKIVEVEKQKQDIRSDVTTVVTTKPDGTTTSTTTDHSTTTTVTDTNSVATSEHSKVTTYKKPDWKIGALVGTDFNNFSLSKSSLVYGGIVERRILGPIFIGGYGVSNGTFGLSVSFEF